MTDVCHFAAISVLPRTDLFNVLWFYRGGVAAYRTRCGDNLQLEPAHTYHDLWTATNNRWDTAVEPLQACVPQFSAMSISGVTGGALRI